MIVPILLGIIAFLYLAGLALAAEYTDAMEEEDLKHGVPKMAKGPKIRFLLAWPYHITTAIFTDKRSGN